MYEYAKSFFSLCYNIGLAFPPVLLGRKASKLRKQLGIPMKGKGSERVTTPYEGTDRK